MGSRSGTATRGGSELITKREEELVASETVARSFDCEGEATTIEPLVSGQQFIAPDCGAEGIVSRICSA